MSPDGNSRPQNTGMNATFSLVVTSFIQKDALVKAEVEEHATRDALTVCKNTLSFDNKVKSNVQDCRLQRHFRMMIIDMWENNGDKM